MKQQSLLLTTGRVALLSVLLGTSSMAQQAAPAAPDAATPAAPATAAPAPAPVPAVPATSAPASDAAAPAAPATATPAPAVPTAPAAPATAAPTPAPAAPAAPAIAAPAPAKKDSMDAKIEALSTLYGYAAATHICEIDLADSEDEKLQANTDAAEEAAGLPDDTRDGLWLKIVTAFVADKKNICKDAASEVVQAVRAMKN